jgi:hypothetical protein
MNVLGETRFDQGVINMSLINMCDRDSYVGQELRKVYHDYQEDNEEAIASPWQDSYQFTIYVPHPDQEYEEITLEEGLSRGYNVEVKRIVNRSQIPYKIPEGGHFVIVLKQAKLNGEFKIAATGMFIRPLGILNLDLIVDMDADQYQPLVIKHPIIRDYPGDWENKLLMFLKQEIPWQELPNVVNYVDCSFNRDYRRPHWREVYLGATGFSGF